MSAVAELEESLRAMLRMKAPGVSGTKIVSITALCVANVQSESVIIQKLFMHFKKTPPTHKLGVLYVVDNVTRKWLDHAKLQGQVVSSTAPDGTFAAGVHRVTELIPILMNDMIATAPEDQKDKIKKLLDIWEKGSVFPAPLVTSFREKLNAARPTAVSTTPTGTPPPTAVVPAMSGASAPPPKAAVAALQGMPNIMEALANIARQNTAAAQTKPAPPVSAPTFPVSTGAPAPAPALLGAVPGQHALSFMGAPQSATPPMNIPGSAYSLPPAPQAPYASAPAPAPALHGGPLGGMNNMPPAYPPGPPAMPGAIPGAPLDPKVQQQLALITTLMSQGLPPDQVTKIVQQVMATTATPGPAAPLPAQGMGYPMGGAAGWDGQRDRDGRDHGRSPQYNRGRSRSRSPRGRGSRDSPRGRGNDRSFGYGRDMSPGRNGRPDDRDRGRGGRGSEYRQRSPVGHREQTPPAPDNASKWVEHDPRLPEGHIKVFSRTLFVGGVTCPESELRQLFTQYGQVQTCIVNKEKRHAFVKMYYRKDAERAKEAMEEPRSTHHQLRTRWGVGFGPRDCSDYQTGISVIPIHKLTDADRKWMVTAPYGGSGGRPIETGLCVEEPDIEIGAGVSSKAISRRMQTDKGGNHGPKSSRRDDEPGFGSGPGQFDGGRGGSGGGGGGGSRWRRGGGREGRNSNGDRHGRHETDDDPVVANLPPGFTMGPNGINVPAGFSLGTS